MDSQSRKASPEPSAVSLFLLSCIPCSRGMWKGPADLAHAYLQVSSAAPPFSPPFKARLTAAALQRPRAFSSGIGARKPAWGGAAMPCKRRPLGFRLQPGL